jgi:type IV secretion system protein VirB11
MLLRPLQQWLESPDIVEIAVNEPGIVYIERLGSLAMERHVVPELSELAIRKLAQVVATTTRQAVNEETPILSAHLPTGERFQAILPPVAERGGVIAIRKQVVKKLSLADYARLGAFDHVEASGAETLTGLERELVALLRAGEMQAFIATAVRHRISMIIAGGTSSGKTTLLNAILREIPHEERLVSMEDARELDPPHQNYVPLLTSKGGQGMGGQGIARIAMQDLLMASLRLRPDRIFLGELRGDEAYAFLRAVNTGHPGSLTTVHADSPGGAYEQVALMTMQGGVPLTKAEIVDYVKSVIPIVIQVSRIGGARRVTEIFYAKYRPDVAQPSAPVGRKAKARRAS